MARRAYLECVGYGSKFLRHDGNPATFVLHSESAAGLSRRLRYVLIIEISNPIAPRTDDCIPEGWNMVSIAIVGLICRGVSVLSQL